MPAGRHQPLPDALEVRARHCVDLAEVARAVCDVLHTRVPYDFGCLAVTDPATGLISWAYKSRPLLVGDEEFAAAEYGGSDINQFAEIAARRDPVGVLSIDTGGDLGSCRRFRDFLAPRFGFTDELRVVFRVRGLTWGALALYRGPGEPAFTAEEGRTGASVQVQIAMLIRRALFRPALPNPGSPPGPAVIIVDTEDRVTHLTPAAQTRIEDLGGWDHGSLPSPVLVTSAAARTTSAPATNRAVGRDGAWLVVRATPFAAAMTAGTSSTRDELVITVEGASPSEVSALAMAARGLSAREQEVAGLVLQGVATKGISEALHLSPHTVQDHLKSIFSKLGVNSRREMVQKLVLR
ncbi:MAG: helix-turn-helix transcriptional regulator [Terracoccus sp.]